MSNDAIRIANLLYRYAELMDSGDLEATASLFAEARITLGDGRVVEGSAPMLELWRAHVRIHEDGTPRTKHVVSNPIIEIDEAAGTATARSYYTVLLATAELPLQVIGAGRYHDAFVRNKAGEWRFSARDYSMFDLVGDVSQHLLIPVTA